MNIEIDYGKKALNLELGPAFNYRREHKLSISLNAGSLEIIKLRFNIANQG